MSGFGKVSKITPGSNKLWEGSRMMLPEHVEGIKALQREELRKAKPELDEQKVEEIEWKLREAIEEKSPVEINLFDDFEDVKVIGLVTRIDTQYKRVRVEYEEDYDWIRIDDILEIEIM